MNANEVLARTMRGFTGYKFVDYATQGYLLLVALLVFLFHGRSVSSWPLLIAAHGGMIALVHGLIRAQARCPRIRVLDFVRHFYPVLLYAGFYRESGFVNQMFVTGYLDPAFIRLEETLFGCQPSLVWMARWPFPALSELFYAAYFSYYVMIAGVGLALFLRAREQFFHYVSVVSFVFYVCYVVYICLPVMGPRIFSATGSEFALPAEMLPPEVPMPPAAVQAGVFYQLMAFIYAVFEAPGAAFPSSHVAVGIVTLRFSFLYLRKVRMIHLVAVALLCPATVYCRYHYAVDVIAGAATAAILIPAGNRLYAVFARPRPRPWQ